MSAKKAGDNINILFVCGYGVGTSVIMENNVRQELDILKIGANMEHAAGGDVSGFKQWADIIAISKKLVNVVQLEATDDVHVIEIVNLMDGKRIADQVVAIIKEHYPEILG